MCTNDCETILAESSLEPVVALWGMFLSNPAFSNDKSNIPFHLLRLALGLHSPDMTIHLTDLVPMLPLIQKNVSLNPTLLSPVHPSILSWGCSSPPVASGSTPAIPAHPEILLAADCVYFEPSFPLLSATMQNLIGPDTVCYFCFQKRRRADMTFVKGLRKMFSIRDVTDDPDKPVWQRQGLFL